MLPIISMVEIQIKLMSLDKRRLYRFHYSLKLMVSDTKNIPESKKKKMSKLLKRKKKKKKKIETQKNVEINEIMIMDLNEKLK
jgi:hypothetical protein